MTDKRASRDDDEDDWQDLEKPSKADELPDVSFRCAPFAGRHGKNGKCRASAVLRRGAADWVRKHGPRFKIQVGGPHANKVRLIPDSGGGQYEPAEFHGVFRLMLGVVNLWPNESRDATPAKWAEVSRCLVLTLPEDWARSGHGATPPAIAPKDPQPKPAVPSAVPLTTAAPGLQRAQTARRNTTAALMGDPPAGRSALAQRKSQ
jgi:hypothetical protein